MTRPQRRLLLVTSAFPPTMLADMQRARMLAADLPEAGWEVEVLTPGVGYQRPLWVEPDADGFRPKGVAIHETSPGRVDVFLRGLGIGSVGWRSFWSLYRKGTSLLRQRRFDLVYITTTQFNLFCLGRLWLQKFGVPYVLDFHDPWYRPRHSHVTTPRDWKFYAANRLSKWMERFAVSKAGAVVSVSPNYLDDLSARYRKVFTGRQIPSVVIPFAATKSDFNSSPAQSGADAVSSERRQHDIVYVGAGGTIMANSFVRIVQALGKMRAANPKLLDTIKIRLFGTYAYWKVGESTPLQDIAAINGVGDLVEEQPARVTYRRAMDLISNADGLIILGVDDPAYMPSKLYAYALTGKPLLVSLHRNSQANRYFREIPVLGHLIHFGEGGTVVSTEEEREVEAFLTEVLQAKRIDRNRELEPYLSSASALKHAELFERAISR